MAQTILIQDAALKQLNGRIGELEARLTQMQQQQPQQSSGGFLSGLFGGGSRSQPQQQPPAASSAWGAPSAQPSLQQPPAAAATSAGRGFLGGALQTAAGVAGGVVLADMLTSMFHRSQPEEIVNIINEPAMPETDFNNNLDTFNGADNASFLNQDSGQQDYANSSDNDSFANDGFDSSDFDDDSFV